MTEKTLSVNYWCCTIDLMNNQQQYSKCAQLIRWLEALAIDKDNPTEQVKQLPIEFRISRAGMPQIRTAGEIIYLERMFANDPKRYSSIQTAEQLINGLKKSKKESMFSYYLRVHINQKDNDITDLLYLLLVLQAIPEIAGRIVVRIMEEYGNQWKTDDYYRVSHFIRFIQRQYSCFYACYDDTIESLRSLDLAARGIQTTFVPLLEVNGQLCQKLNKTWRLYHNYTNQPYDKLYTAVIVDGCPAGDLTSELFQISFRMLIDGISGHKYKSTKKKKEWLDFFCSLVQESQGVTPLDFLLFGVIAKSELNSELDFSIAKKCLGKAQIISLALGQILENIVNHSQRNRGAFTFRIHGNTAYLEKHYPQYNVAKNNSCLEILVADSNWNDGIIQHFLDSNKAAAIVRSRSSEIELSQLFGDYSTPDIMDIWQTARSERPEMCHGLISFAENIKKAGGAVMVRSAASYMDETTRNFYYYNGTESGNGKQVFTNMHFIPGTQFSIAIRLPMLIDSDLSSSDVEMFDYDKLVYATTYKELAQALSFDPKVCMMDISEILSSPECFPTDQNSKDNAVSVWKKWFNNKLEETKCESRKVFQCDLEKLGDLSEEHPECAEPFCKGFLGSDFFKIESDDRYNCVLMLNLSPRLNHLIYAALLAVKAIKDFRADKTVVYFFPKEPQRGTLPYYATSLQSILHIKVNEVVFPRVFPYMLFIRNAKGYTLFEERLLTQAETAITDNSSQGFKIGETHMRLGNKVHLDAFYEMALFFEDPNYAYYTAYLLLREFMKDWSDDLKQRKKLLLYGYASYSRAIIWASIKILEQYMLIQEWEGKPEIAFVIYQNDLKLKSEQPEIQMYYSKETWQRDPKSIWEPENTLLVMIVPISSSLTTFNKMLSELNRETGKAYLAEINYTAFWVRNHLKENHNSYDEEKPTKVEEPFWQKTDPNNKTIESDLVHGKIHYMMSAFSGWSNPLRCDKCFPSDPIMEYPLVETDPTSTVPTQQYYKDRIFAIEDLADSPQDIDNDRRVAHLKGNVVYGHISKGSNHYQYYVKTRLFFQQERSNIEGWLKNLREKAEKDKMSCVTDPACINILVIPEEADNVEFSQYVYEYFFNGSAECIVINTEKEYRSNFQAEYSGLFNRLQNIESPWKNVRFHYIDISIRSGSSFHRVLSLLSSCMLLNKPANKNVGKGSIQFEKIFLLINRLSDASKQLYINEAEKNYHAYADVHISVMRTFGDSCVPCRIQMEAERYYKKAATKRVSSYWEEKTYTRAYIPFDKIEILEKENPLGDQDTQEGFMRMMCAHRASHYIKAVQGASVADYFYVLRKFFDEICTSGLEGWEGSPVYEQINDINRKEWLSAGLKVIVRPFFSFDYKTRCAVMDLYLILAEILIKGCSINQIKERLDSHKEKRYLLGNGNLEWIDGFANMLRKMTEDNTQENLEFVRNHILKGLADIKSNYILRKETILKIAECLDKVEVSSENEKEEFQDEFFQHYLRSVLRLTHSSSDETKGVWLEYLLQKGEEYPKEDSTELLQKENVGIETLILDVPKSIQKALRHFLEILLVENNRPMYQSVVEADKVLKQSGKLNHNADIKTQEIKILMQEYHMRNASSFFSFGNRHNGTAEQILSLRELFNQLETTKIDGNSDVTNRYMRLGERIQQILKDETEVSRRVVLFGKSEQNRNSGAMEYLHLSDYFILYPERFAYINEREKSEDQIEFEKRWGEVQDNLSQSNGLDADGFWLFESGRGDERYGVIIKLDNNLDYLKESSYIKRMKIEIGLTKIEPIYIYVPCSMKRQQALGFVRKILMFRSKLIGWLENDFNNNAIADLSKQQYLSRLLSTDKMGDHAENDFIETLARLLSATDKEEFDKEGNLWKYGIAVDTGLQVLAVEGGTGDAPFSQEKLVRAREWFLLRSYINSRISRLFRTMVRMVDDYENNGLIDYDTYYGCDGQSTMMRPVENLRLLFFTPIKVGYIRKNYLKQILKTVCVFINGIPDYRKWETKEDDKQAGLDDRLDNISCMLEEFHCIRVDKNNYQYAYLSEYLIAILMDCFVSALKAGERWNKSGWGGEAFVKVESEDPDKKCRIDIKREKGGKCGNIKYDYLTISNLVYTNKQDGRKGPGMSQAAMRWYIEGLWRTCVDSVNYPKVQCREEENKYYAKLPILKGNRE